MRKFVAVLVVVGAVMLVPAFADAGAVNGPVGRNDSVKARATDVYKIAFWGGERAIVRVRGDGDTDLDLYVYDAAGNLVAFDDDNTDNCVVGFTPARTGTFTIRIVNRGSVFNRYRLQTN